MNVIYEPKGQAREYAPLAANLYVGCVHGCRYCFAPGVLRRNRQQFHSAAQPRRGGDVMRLFEADCLKLRGSGKRVLLSFATDPYQPVDEELKLTRRAIELLHEHGMFVEVLTKGGMRAVRDFDLLGPGDAFATTLTFLDERRSRAWEPNAALPDDRIRAIREAHELGIPTWASLEPVLDRFETLEIIRETAEVVDLFKVGLLNYSAAPTAVDWGQFGIDVEALLIKLGKAYYIKDGLRAAMQSKSVRAHRSAMSGSWAAMMAQKCGEREKARILFGQALADELAAIRAMEEAGPSEPSYSVLHRSAATLALDCGDPCEAERIAARGLAGEPPPEIAEELRGVLAAAAAMKSATERKEEDR
jgi:pyruvate-formate lyase-activating enzyme